MATRTHIFQDEHRKWCLRSDALSLWKDAFQGMLNASLGTYPDTLEKDVLVALFVFVSSGQNIVPQRMLGRVAEPDQGTLEVVLPQFAEVLECVRKGGGSLLKLEMVSLNTSLRFDALFSSYGSKNYKVTLVNSSDISSSLVFDMRRYVVMAEDQRIDIPEEALTEFLERVSDDLLRPILSEWYSIQLNLPTLVAESREDSQADHFRRVLDVIEGSTSASQTVDRDVLVSIIICILSEREIVPHMLQEHCFNTCLESFAFNKSLCKSVAENMQIVLDFARQQKANAPIKLQMGHTSNVSFIVLASNYGTRNFKVTFMCPPPSTSTLTCTFDMKRCLTDSATKLEFNFLALREFAHKISDALLYPILTSWWQEQQLYIRLPYLLGVTEDCIIKISKYLGRKDSNNLRLTSRRLRVIASRPRILYSNK